ncbi:MAG: hypothetical protein ABIK44_05335 [candidate division WOR-3 bacterium]
MPIFVSLVLLTLAILAYRRQFSPSGSWPLFIVRLLVIVALSFIIIDKLITIARTERPQRVVMLVDNSQSMTAIGADSLARSLAQNIQLPAGVQRDLWLFADSALPLAKAGRAEPGARTRLGRALELAAEKRPGAIVVLSDGQDNGELEPVNVAHRLNVPVWTIGFGSLTEQNAAIEGVIAPDPVFSGDTFSVTVRLSSGGFEQRSIRLTLGTEQRLVTVDPEFAEQEVQFQISAQQPGRLTLTARLESLPGEKSYADNSKTVVIGVRPGRFGVMLLANRPGPETRFFQHALAENPRVTLRTGLALQGSLAISESEKWEKETQVFILDAIAEKGNEALFTRIGTRVKQGAGALVLAGPGFSPGPVLASLLPLESLAAPESGFFTPAVINEGRQVPWFDPTTGIDLNAVPPFAGMTRVKPRSGYSHVWLSCQENGLPLLVLGSYGKGRVAFVSGFPLWRWGFGPNWPTPSKTPLQVLLEGLISYLTDVDTVRFRLQPDKPGFLSGEDVKLLLTARTPDGAPWSGLTVMLWVDSEQTLIPMTELDQGRYQALFPAPRPGEHQTTAEIKLGSTPVDRVTSAFHVEEQSIELTDIGINRRLLRAIAEASGGRFFPADESLRADLSDIKLASYQRQLSLDPRRTWWLYCLIPLAVSAEIVLRRRRGLL